MPQPAPVAIITGGGSGIGRAAAIGLALRGWRLALIGRTESKLDETQRLIAEAIDEPVDFMSVAADIAEDGIPEAIIDGVAEHFERLDALINNAGVVEMVALRDSYDAMIRATFAVNTFAVIRMIREAWPVFEKTRTEHPDARPCVINISSMATVDPFPGLGVYAASKAAVESVVRSIVNERDHLNLRAFAIAPGSVETPMLRSIADEQTVPPDRTLEPQDVAEVIIACIEGRRDDEDGRTILLPSPG